MTLYGEIVTLTSTKKIEKLVFFSYSLTKDDLLLLCKFMLTLVSFIDNISRLFMYLRIMFCRV